MVSVPTPGLGDCVLPLNRLAGSARPRQNVTEMAAPIDLRTPASTEANCFTRVRMEAGQQWRTPTDPTPTSGASDAQDRTVCRSCSPTIRIDGSRQNTDGFLISKQTRNRRIASLPPSGSFGADKPLRFVPRSLDGHPRIRTSRRTRNAELCLSRVRSIPK